MYPVALPARLGVTSLKKSLDTTNLKIAIVRFHRVMAEFERRLAQARAPVAADLWKPFTIETPDSLKPFSSLRALGCP